MSLNFLRKKNVVKQQRNLLYYHLDRGKKPKHILEILSYYEKKSLDSITLENDKSLSTNDIRQNADHGHVETDIMIERDQKEKLPEFVHEVEREMLSLPSEYESGKDKDKKINDGNVTTQNWEKAANHIEKLLSEISESQNSDQEDQQRLSTIEDIFGDRYFNSNQNDLPESERGKKSFRLKSRLDVEDTNKQNQSEFDRDNSHNTVSLAKQEESLKRIVPTKRLRKPKNQQENTGSKSPLDVTELQNIAAMAKRLRTPSKIKRSSQTNTEKH